MLSIKQNILSSQSLTISSALQKKIETPTSSFGSNAKKIQTPELRSTANGYENRLQALSTAELNIQEGISKVQVADSALADTDSILTKMRELALKSSDANLSEDERVKLQEQLDDLKAEIDSVSGSAEFNNHKLLDGGGIRVQTTSFASITAAITINSQFSLHEMMAALKSGESFTIPVKQIDSESLGLTNAKIGSEMAAKDSLNIIDSATARVSTERKELNSVSAKLSFSLNHMQSISNNLFAAGSGTLNSVDSAFDLISKTKTQLNLDPQTVISAHLGNIPKNALSLLG